MAEKNDFIIERVFDAPKDLVWEVYTNEQHLARWWGPKGFKMLKSKLDLRPGGMFHYGMESPDGHVMWGRFIYREVIPKNKIVFIVSFSDEKGGITRHPMAPTWPAETINTATFTESNGKTTVTLKGHPINSSPEEDALFYSAFESMNQGFKGTFDQLEEYLKSLTA